MRVLLCVRAARGPRTASGTRGAVAGAEVQVARPLHGQIGFSWSTPNTSVRGSLRRTRRGPGTRQVRDLQSPLH
jgi:hypothetical protein